MTTGLFGLRSSVSDAGVPAYLGARAKLASLLFDAVLFEAGSMEIAGEAAGEVRERWLRQGIPGGPKRVLTEAGSGPAPQAAGFDAVLDALRVTGCEWAGIVAGRSDAVVDDDISSVLSERITSGSLVEWLAAGLATDLTLARRLNSVLLPGPAAGDRLSAAGGVAVSHRAIVAPDPSGIPWEHIERLRGNGSVIAVRRLILELLALVERGLALAAIETFEALGPDIEELLWRSVEEQAGPAQRAVVLRLATLAEPTDQRTWVALLAEVRPL